MTTLKINLYGLAMSPGLIAAPSQRDQVVGDYSHFPSYVTLTGLSDWTLYKSEFLGTMSAVGKDTRGITFEEY